MNAVTYLHLPPSQTPPDLVLGPFRAVVIIEEPVDAEWQERVSDWLVRSGCLYMVAWGIKCTTWDDSVDHSMLAAFNYEEVPDEKFVMTTWHEDEPLGEALWFARHCAFHPDVELEHTLLVHIAPQARAEELLGAYREVDAE